MNGGDVDEFDEGVDDGVDCEDLDTVPCFFEAGVAVLGWIVFSLPFLLGGFLF